jgi:hypothetical protein
MIEREEKKESIKMVHIVFFRAQKESINTQVRESGNTKTTVFLLKQESSGAIQEKGSI